MEAQTNQTKDSERRIPAYTNLSFRSEVCLNSDHIGRILYFSGERPPELIIYVYGEGNFVETIHRRPENDDNHRVDGAPFIIQKYVQASPKKPGLFGGYNYSIVDVYASALSKGLEKVGL